MRSRSRILAALLLVLATVLAACTPPMPAPIPPTQAVQPTAATTKFKVAMIGVGPQGDLGWSQSHYEGLMAMSKAVPGVDVAYFGPVAEPDSERFVRDLATKGYNLVIATSFGYMDYVVQVAKQFPQVKFLHCTGYKTSDNLGIYDGRGYQAWYLSGIVAGRMSKSGKLGYVAPYPIPEVTRNMSAFALGARSVNPKAEVRPVWISAWYEPQKEREAALALADEGCDVIARESDSPEPEKVAKERGIYSVGYNIISPDNGALTGPVWHWSVYYTGVVQDIMKGSWTNTPVWWGMDKKLNGVAFLDLAPMSPKVPTAIQDEVNKAKARIESGELVVFTGPLKDNTGKERIPAGQKMTDEQMLNMDWLVEGVVGVFPTQ